MGILEEAHRVAQFQYSRGMSCVASCSFACASGPRFGFRGIWGLGFRVPLIREVCWTLIVRLID